MKKFLIYFTLFILTISLVAAVEIKTDKYDHTGDEIATIRVSDCIGTSIVKIINPGFTLVDIKSGNGNWVADYNTLSDSADGKYTLSVTCTNGAATGNFCVDSDGCMGTTPPPTPPGGGGTSCTSDWSCSTWSYCDANLKETRSCIDLEGCENPKTETRDCTLCLESWVCSIWSDCRMGSNERNCYDEHKCGTSSLKPNLRKSCSSVSASGSPPVRVSSQLPPPYVPLVQKESALKEFWNDYGMYLILGLAILAVLIVVIILTLHFLKSRKMAHNINELKQWVKKERAMGTSMEDIKEILKSHTGWKKKEIEAVTQNSIKPNVKTKK